MSSLTDELVEGVAIDGTPLHVNRSLIEMGEKKQIVYYWFQQRGRSITNEYAVKWYIFWDALTRNRTDGALVRIIAPVATGETVADVDKRLIQFMGSISPLIHNLIPS